MRYLTSLAVLTLASVLPACGGGSGSLGAAIGEGLYQMFPAVDEARSGSVASDGIMGTPTPDRFMQVGDDFINESWRGFVTYNLPVPRPGYELERAELLLTPDRYLGNPIRDLGSVYLQKVNIGATLDRFDYNRSAVGWIRALDVRDNEQHELDVAALVRLAYDDGTGNMTLRFRALDVDGDLDNRNDQTIFYQPLLVLHWRPIP